MLGIAPLAAVLLTAMAGARSLSYRMRASEQRACFYATVDPRVDFSTATVQFYFAASDAKGTESAYVDAVVTGPTGTVAHNQKRQTHAEINVKPNQAGEYALCVSHSAGSVADKNIDVDITLPVPQAVGAAGTAMDEASAKLKSALGKLHGELLELVQTLRLVKTRERGNLATIDTISSWVSFVSVFEILLIVGMSAAQITILRTFFARPSSSSRGGI